ncbi:MAG: RNA-binding protein S1 [Streptococcaceae bacterium]|jgi:S1 RNA binding domain protein|nr:RNA-binding protein S1 [Streptococcaceae bacterium]
MSIEVGSILQGKVTKITNFGAFVKLPEKKRGLIHVSEVSTKFIKEISDVLKVGDKISVKVISVSDDGKIALSIKQILKLVNRKKNFSHSKTGDFKGNKVKKDASFDALMSSFLKSSEEKLSSLRRNTEGKRGGRGGRRL